MRVCALPSSVGRDLLGQVWRPGVLRRLVGTSAWGRSFPTERGYRSWVGILCCRMPVPDSFQSHRGRRYQLSQAQDSQARDVVRLHRRKHFQSSLYRLPLLRFSLISRVDYIKQSDALFLIGAFGSRSVRSPTSTKSVTHFHDVQFRPFQQCVITISVIGYSLTLPSQRPSRTLPYTRQYHICSTLRQLPGCDMHITGLAGWPSR